MQIPYERFLDAVEFSQLDVDRLPCSFEVLCAFCQILTTLDPSRGNCECTLQKEGSVRPAKIKGGMSNLQLLVDALQAIDRRIESANLTGLQLQLLFEIRQLVDIRLALSCILQLELALGNTSHPNR